MIYYKVLDDEGNIGVATSDDLRKYQSKHNILIFAEAEQAECILVNNMLYRAKWMKPFNSDFYSCQNASIRAIGEDEYRALLEPETDIAPDGEPREELVDEILEDPTAEPDESDASTSDYVRKQKLAQLAAICRKQITDGFDVQLDGKTMHFSLKASDQLNLNAAAVALLNGETAIPYHADGGKFELFTADDMRSVIDAANAHRLYHLAYFNSLKAWMKSMTKISTIQAVEYGSEIPSKYRTKYFQSFEKEDTPMP